MSRLILPSVLQFNEKKMGNLNGFSFLLQNLFCLLIYIFSRIFRVKKKVLLSAGGVYKSNTLKCISFVRLGTPREKWKLTFTMAWNPYGFYASPQYGTIKVLLGLNMHNRNVSKSVNMKRILSALHN